MRLYYRNDEDAPGKRLIMAAVYDRDLFAFYTGGMNPDHSTLDIDEVDPENKAVCRALAYNSPRDVNGERRFYIDADSDLAENEGWEPYEEPPL